MVIWDRFQREFTHLLSFRDVALLAALFRKRFCKDVVHTLWRESNGKRVISLVTRHGGDMKILWVWEVGLGRSIDIAEQLGLEGH